MNEKGALASEGVRRAFAEHDVAALKADYTKQPPELTRILRWFGRSGVPMYLIVPGERPSEPVVLSEVLQPGDVVAELEAASR